MHIIINLKHLNKYIKYNHLKVESLLDVFDITQSNCQIASVDLKDAFYSISID